MKGVKEKQDKIFEVEETDMATLKVQIDQFQKYGDIKRRTRRALAQLDSDAILSYRQRQKRATLITVGCAAVAAFLGEH